MNDTESSRALQRQEVGRAAAALVIFESVDGSDCRNREVIQQTVTQRMACKQEEDAGTYVFVRMAQFGEMFEPFRTDEFIEEFEACISSDGAGEVMAGVRAFADEFLFAPLSSWIH